MKKICSTIFQVLLVLLILIGSTWFVYFAGGNNHDEEPELVTTNTGIIWPEYPTKGIGMILDDNNLLVSIHYWEIMEDGENIKREMIALTHDGFILIAECKIPIDIIVEQFREKYYIKQGE